MFSSPSQGRAGTWTIARAVLTLLAVSVAVSGCSGGNRNTNGAGGSPRALSPTVSAIGPTTPSAAATQPPDEAPLAAFEMPKFNVSGKIVVKGIDPATNTMQSPDNKDDVAYYDFTGRPGFGCPSAGKCANTVLSAHVDWYTGQVGVFWHLKDLKDGDEIDLKLEDGNVYKYKVVANTVYKSEEAPIQDILGDTPQESLTLITCDGVFNKSSQEYNMRRIVRATREV